MLILMRHATATLTQNDEARQLSDAGRMDATHQGRALKTLLAEYNTPYILISPFKRCHETWQAVNASLAITDTHCLTVDWLAPDTPSVFIEDNALGALAMHPTPQIWITHEPVINHLLPFLTGKPVAVPCSPATFIVLSPGNTHHNHQLVSIEAPN